MSTLTESLGRDQATWWFRTLVVAITLLLGSIYYVTFNGSDAIRTKRNSVAFADTSHYVELLTGQHWLECLQQNPPHNVEHRRKTVHHLDYLLFGSTVMAVGGVAGADDLSLIWLVTPLLGALNFVLAFTLFRREAGQALALPGALAYALIPATWVYASIPETWMLSGTAVLVVMHLRGRGLPQWAMVLLIALFALNNFLLLLLVLLLQDDRQPIRQRILQMIGLGALALVAWLALLTILGFILSPDFMPHRFFDLTVRFKDRMAEHLSIVHPARWAYNAVNGWLVPFVLNQSYLNFGRTAIIDSARAFPLGTLAVIGLLFLVLSILRNQVRVVMAGVRATHSWLQQISGIGMYLTLVFIATGLALYYESFLYSPMIIPVLLLLALRSLPASRTGVLLMWGITAIWALNAAQQMATYRVALGV